MPIMPITRHRRYILQPVPGLLAIAAFLLVTACDNGPATPTPPPAATHDASVLDYTGLIDALQKTGASVKPVGDIQQPFLSVSGRTIDINNQQVQVYEYPDPTAAERDSSKIQPDATIPGTSIMWVAQPHFYRLGTGRIIVLYTGTDATVLNALESVMGKPFAVGANFSGPTTPTP